MQNHTVAEVKELVEEVLSGTDDCVKVDYLVNVLSYDRHQNLTVKEIFEAELKAKNEMEAEFKRRKEEAGKTS